MDLNTWFHWILSSPGYFLLALAGLLVLFGLIGGLTDTRKFGDVRNSLQDEEALQSGMPWRTRDERHYQEWNAYQVREHHRSMERRSK